MKKTAQYEHAYLINVSDQLPSDFPVEADFERLICGVFLPPRHPVRVNRSAHSARMVLLFQDQLTVVPHPATESSPTEVRLDEIFAIEHRRVLPDAMITARTPDVVQEWSYDLHAEGFVWEFLFQFRHDEPTERRAIRATFGEPLDHKFGCGESDNLDRSEPLIARFFHAPMTLIRKKCFLKTTMPGEYLALMSEPQTGLARLS